MISHADCHVFPPTAGPEFLLLSTGTRRCLRGELAWWKRQLFSSTLGAIVSLETTVCSRIGIDKTQTVCVDFLKTLASACLQVRPHGPRPWFPRGRVWYQEGSRKQWVQCFIAGPFSHHIGFKGEDCCSVFLWIICDFPNLSVAVQAHWFLPLT